ncbi:MAG: alpha/beta hydrolase [Pseudomonadota bacterium]
MTAFVVALAALLALPLLAELRRRPMTRARQANAPGEMADLPRGRTHYRWSGHVGDPVVVCIHGLSTPSYIFAATERSLTALGYRVLTYDLYGRGFSARATGVQNMRFFLGQLSALLIHQQVTGPVSVLGFSMGGQIAAAFAARDDRVERLILVAPSGLVEGDGPGRLWIAPVTGDWLTRVFGGVMLRRELVEHKTRATVIPDFEDRQAAETRMRGYLPAVLSARRHVLNAPAEQDHREVAARKLPVLAIWGSEDPVVPLKALGALARLNPNATHVEVKGASHTLLQTHPSEVAAALKRFLVE